MIEQTLGLPIDIHGGGNDLIFPHHENEIAQGICAEHAGGYANYWMHNGFLNMGDRKMSKSLGNVQLVHDLIDRWPGEALRWALLLGSHYRQPLSLDRGGCRSRPSRRWTSFTARCGVIRDVVPGVDRQAIGGVPRSAAPTT